MFKRASTVFLKCYLIDLSRSEIKTHVFGRGERKPVAIMRWENGNNISWAIQWGLLNADQNIQIIDFLKLFILCAYGQKFKIMFKKLKFFFLPTPYPISQSSLIILILLEMVTCTSLFVCVSMSPYISVCLFFNQNFIWAVSVKIDKLLVVT